MDQDTQRAWHWARVNESIAGLTAEETWRHPRFRLMVGFSRIRPSPNFLQLARSTHGDVVESILRGFASRGLPLEPNLAVSGRNDNLGIDGAHITALHVYFVARICRYANTRHFQSVVEIGGGFGDLARLLAISDVAHGICLVDLPEMLRVQRWFLSRSLGSLAAIEFVDATSTEALDALAGRNFDLGISTYALNETPDEVQSMYVTRLLEECKHVYLAGPRHGLQHAVSLLLRAGHEVAEGHLPSACHLDDIDIFTSAPDPAAPDQ